MTIPFPDLKGWILYLEGTKFEWTLEHLRLVPEFDLVHSDGSRDDLCPLMKS